MGKKSDKSPTSQQANISEDDEHERATMMEICFQIKFIRIHFHMLQSCSAMSFASDKKG